MKLKLVLLLDMLVLFEKTEDLENSKYIYRENNCLIILFKNLLPDEMDGNNEMLTLDIGND